jgi:hypothetical protein
VSAPPEPYHVAVKPSDNTVASVTNLTNMVCPDEVIRSGSVVPVRLASFEEKMSPPSNTLT